jgi:DNA-nicking Smr family endonuclease
MGRAPRSVPTLSNEDSAAFREAVRGATRITAAERAAPAPVMPPIPVQSLIDEHAALAQSLTAPLSAEDGLDTGEELHYLRDGLPRGVLKKLRAGHWVVQDSLDLHGANQAEARELVAGFLLEARRRRLRCLRIVHGKGLGSPRREPVLRGKIRVWLARRDEILAYCQAPAHQGGSGATLVLLKG